MADNNSKWTLNTEYVIVIMGKCQYGDGVISEPFVHYPNENEIMTALEGTLGSEYARVEKRYVRRLVKNWVEEIDTMEEINIMQNTYAQIDKACRLFGIDKDQLTLDASALPMSIEQLLDIRKKEIMNGLYPYNTRVEIKQAINLNLKSRRKGDVGPWKQKQRQGEGEYES